MGSRWSVSAGVHGGGILTYQNRFQHRVDGGVREHDWRRKGVEHSTVCLTHLVGIPNQTVRTDAKGTEHVYSIAALGGLRAFRTTAIGGALKPTGDHSGRRPKRQEQSQNVS